MSEFFQKRSSFRFAFGLRTLFLLVTMVALWLGWNLRSVRQRERLLAEHGVVYYFATESSSGRGLPWTLKLLGAKTVIAITLPPGDFTNADLARFQSAFPEAAVRRLPLFDSQEIQTMR